ncbi:MAG: hypothetical protein ABJ239_02515 [Erythrobacter sp.]
MNRVNPILLAAFILAACSGEPSAESSDDTSGKAAAIPAEDREPLGLMTSLPLYWPEGADMDAMLDGGDQEMPWVREHLEQQFALSALDTLSADQQEADVETAAGPLDVFERLMIVQPRGLSPADNVALDAWVAAGGRLLIALDPLLVGQYSYPLGDPRNPVLSTLIPPVIDRWGMSMSFSERQPLAMQRIQYEGGELPMVMSGELQLDSEAEAVCTLEADNRIASCAVGEGRVTVVADATIFEVKDHGASDKVDLQDLIEKAFD